jgi:ParB family transcriptional regulator, chromosome partitioning protein
MESKRILIVEADHGFALSIAAVLQASGFTSAIALSAADAQRELRDRRPDLVLLRAELPDLSGFALCGRLRKDKRSQSLPVILISSDATPQALSEHRSHPASAADGYLLMPFQMEDLLGQIQSLLSLAGEQVPALPPIDETPDLVVDVTAPEPTQGAIEEELDGALAEAFSLGGPQAGALGATQLTQLGPWAGTAEGPASMESLSVPLPTRPPRLPKRTRRSMLTEDDRVFLDRVFESIAERKAELLADAQTSFRRTTRRELLATPEGKLQVLREELHRREAHVARLSELWSIRERELTSIDDTLHEKEVEIQAVKLQVDDLLRRLADARDLFVKRDQEHGAVVDSMLLEKFVNEKELIEVVAGKEKDIAGLRRELRTRDQDLAQRGAELAEGSRRQAQLEQERADDQRAAETLERELYRTLARREVEIAGGRQDLDLVFEAAEGAARARAAEVQELRTERRALERELSRAQSLRDFESRAVEKRWEESRLSEGLETAHRQELARLREERGGEVESSLTETEELAAVLDQELEWARRQRDGLHQSLGVRLEEARSTRVRIETDLAAEHDRAVAQQAQMATEISAKVEQIGNLEGELEAHRRDRAEGEAELLASLAQAGEQIQALSQEVQQTGATLSEVSAAREAERVAAAAEQARLAMEVEELGVRAEAKASDLRGALAERDRLIQEQEERWQTQLAEALRRQDTLEQDVIEKARALGEAERKSSQAAAEAARRGDAAAREVTSRGEALRVSEQKLAQREREHATALGDLQGQLQALGETSRQLQEEVGAQATNAAQLVARLDRQTAEKESQRKELSAALAAREARIAELQSSIAGSQQERRRAEEEAASRLQRLEARAKELEAKAEQGGAARERAEREAQQALLSRTRKIQELEQALEQALGVKARLERELGQRVQVAESKALEASQKLVSAQRIQKELETRLAREGLEASARFKTEVERREAQRTQEVGRLQQALQEKAKAVKVLELELQRNKRTAPPTGVPLRAAVPATRPARPAPIPGTPAPEATHRPEGTGGEPKDDLDRMLEKLEI